MSLESYTDLNIPQREAVLHRDSPLLVIAGAGSGKTRTLTYRVYDLIKVSRHHPSRLFVTTFTNKAADEMRERLSTMLGERRSQQLRIGTFHSLCRTILMDLLEYKTKGVFHSPRLLMGGGRYFKSLIWFNRAGLNGKSETKSALLQIEKWKGLGLRVEDIMSMKPKPPFYADYYKVYEEAKLADNYIDFNDMLFKTYWLLSDPENKSFLESVRCKINHILVDEGQDLNKIQFMLVDLLAGTNPNIILVLDDWQQIYGFRGASVDYIKQFISRHSPRS